MPQLLDLIKTQISSWLRIIIEDDQGNVKPYTIFGRTIPVKWIAMLINIIAVSIYLLIFLLFGLYLWNHGLHPVFPNLIEPIGRAPHAQYKSPEVQLFVTLLALMFIF